MWLAGTRRVVPLKLQKNLKRDKWIFAGNPLLIAQQGDRKVTVRICK
jgi:hypothetical protein